MECTDFQVTPSTYAVAGLAVLGVGAVLVLDKRLNVRSRFAAWRVENEDALTTVSDCVTIMVTSMQTLVMVSNKV